MSRATHLKIKLLTLAAESRIIRRDERKALEKARHWKVMDHPEAGPKTESPFLSGRLMEKHYRAYEDLHDHRTGIVRRAARVNHLAYGFLRGRGYAEIEQQTRTEVDLREVWKIVKRFGDPADHVRWPAWQTAAVQHLDAQGVSVTLPRTEDVKEVA